MKTARHAIARYAPFTAMLLLAVTVSCSPPPASCKEADIMVTKTADTNDGSCTGADCSLREAVIHSNTCPGVQTIHIPGGTYTLTLVGADEDLSATGDLDLLDSVNIIGEGGPAIDGNPVIDGNATDRVLDIMNGVTANIAKLTVQNGQAPSGPGIISLGVLNLSESIVRNNITVPPPGWSTIGGGISASGGLGAGPFSLSVDSSEIYGNSASRGGGIGADTAEGIPVNVVISNSTVHDNSAFEIGGGMYLNRDVNATVTNLEASNNTAEERGGGIYNNGTLELTNATLDGNNAGESGGGIFNQWQGTIIARSVLVQNNQSRNGGGIYNINTAKFYQTALVYNQAVGGQGGGVYNDGRSMLLDNSTVSSNRADLGGDGISNFGTLQLRFTTIAYNASEGLHTTAAVDGMHDTILAGHPGGNCVGAAPGSDGHNIDDGATCALAGPDDLSDTDPMLDPLPPGATFPPTHALQAGSPAIDTADPAHCSGTDQRGVIRPQGAGCDRGAYEREEGGGAGGSGLIGGKVWHDMCAVPEHGYPPTPPPGCADPDGDGIFSDADGIYDPGEPGIAGVTLHLKAGTCSAGADLMNAVTDAYGDYSFAGLAAGTYCVSVNALGDGNDLILIPGGWSFPARDVEPVTAEIVLGAGDALTDVDFGWDYQFLPLWSEPSSTPTVIAGAPSFINPRLSADRIYYVPTNSNFQCDPRDVDVRVGLSSSEGVAHVVLYVRLKEQSSGTIGAWADGITMSPAGDNQFLATVFANDIPGSTTFGESWVQYQFVALDAGGGAVARSEVYWNLTFSPCG